MDMGHQVTSQGDVILVTGGCGYVGRSLVHLLVEKYENLAEVIVLDIQKPPQDLVDLMASNKSNAPKIRFVQCDIRDLNALIEACAGVDIVFHLATVVETRRSTKLKPLHDVNVTGTKNVVEACRKNNIEYLVSTSSTEINRGYTARVNATERMVNNEDWTHDELVMPSYSCTKRLGEETVLAANGQTLSNGKKLKTVALRPPGIYGENDVTYVTQVMRTARCFFNVMPILGSVQTQVERIYVGNVAWAHIQAVTALRQDHTVGGIAYNVTDATSSANTFVWMKPILESQSIKVLPVSIPFVLAYYFYFLIELCLWLLSPLVQMRLPVERNHLFLACTTDTYDGNLAKEKLGYEPLYNATQAFARSLEYYSRVV